jgi:hypothetical protein
MLTLRILLYVQDHGLLRKYSAVYPTGGSVDWSAKGDSMHLR